MFSVQYMHLSLTSGSDKTRIVSWHSLFFFFNFHYVFVPLHLLSGVGFNDINTNGIVSQPKEFFHLWMYFLTENSIFDHSRNVVQTSWIVLTNILAISVTIFHCRLL